MTHNCIKSEFIEETVYKPRASVEQFIEALHGLFTQAGSFKQVKQCYDNKRSYLGRMKDKFLSSVNEIFN